MNPFRFVLVFVTYALIGITIPIWFPILLYALMKEADDAIL